MKVRVSLLYRHPWLTIGIILGITLFFAFQIPRIELDNDPFHFIPEDHPERIAFQETEDQFGEALGIVVGIETEVGTIFSPEVLSFVDALTREIEALEEVEDVTSLTNTDYIAPTPEGMEVVPIIEDPTDPSQIARLKERLLSWEMYEGVLYSPDFRATQIIVPIRSSTTEDERQHVYFAIKEFIERTPHPHMRTYIAGTPAVTVLISSNMQKDLVLLIPLVIGVLVLVLALSFRKPGGVILPLTTVIISTIWTVGLMALLGIKLSLIGTVLPVVMMAVGSAYGIHIISHYYDLIRERGGQVSEEEHEEIVASIVRHIGKSVFLAALTTMVGFGSLASSQVRPIQEFGIFSAFGVLVALVVAVTFIPALLIARHRALQVRLNNRKVEKEDLADRFMLFLYTLFSQKKGSILLFALVVVIVGIYGTTLLDKDNVLIDYFRPGTEIREADRFFRERFVGTKTFEIVVEGTEKGALTNPEVLKAMEDLTLYLKDKFPEVKKVVSFTDFLKRINQVLNAPPEMETPVAVGPVSTVSSAPEESSGLPFSFFEEEKAEEGLFFFEEEGTAEGAASEQASPPPAERAPAPQGVTTLSREEFLTILNQAYALAPRADISAAELVRLINRALNWRGAAYYEIPYDPAKYPVETREELSNLISQYLLLYSGSLSAWIDDAIEPSKAKMTVQLATSSSIRAYEIAREAEEYARAHFPEGYTIRTSGQAKVEYALTDLIVKSQTISIAVSLGLVFLILVVTFRSIAAGIYGLIPLGITVLINFGVMGLAGIRLDIPTSMVASLAIGIGIDYAIHFMNYYHRERISTGDREKATRNSMKGVGKAILFNAVSVAAGFLVLLLSQFVPIAYMGLLIALTMATSSAASITLLPAIFAIKEAAFLRKADTTHETGGTT
ncbi:efflux RND transporter permease subunit [Spirochaeta thermophila]|uniref:Transporter n=1 Tax=Winmispira thermophila (strain ATCC 49972 / DSM 6192 / RI 19.B1) TaxID=665571 RepID=E0RT64_WINT6|nr:MMPL family transporter [Spirochaeta thermophila]ADN02360.1 transporter [Spirochaeta thermophila DSM 6192]